jgi:hypothetical protein
MIYIIIYKKELQSYETHYCLGHIQLGAPQKLWKQHIAQQSTLQRDHHHHQPLLQMHQSHMMDPHLQSSIKV